MIPLLESPDGAIVHESAVIMNFANDFAAKNQGLKLWPHDASPDDVKAMMATSNMRLEMLNFDKFLSKFWQALMSKFRDKEKL